ncbi:hypothetical protein BDQ12DRAFT_710033 [Crucibulum laeve]|uniref:DUF974-domain-containing protein n=1 Tax=Crucibulum laeve TaxID=68775 RepID=A0A5C3MCB0_9AGAR|nr:hypothetical protein BDQ12DRAFT_710033 [Crucibulum laeve]
MSAMDGPAHLLSLKVMRVSRPALASSWQPFYSSSPSFSAHSSASILSLQGATPLPGHPKTLRDLTHTSELLTLPASFGSIQLGETFSSCLCVNNEAQVEVMDICLKVEMQTVTAKVVLSESAGQQLAPGDTLESVVHHEIKELGQHVLACTVTYRLPPNARSVPGASEDSNDPGLLTFRKFYKFAVTNPLSVKTKVHTPKSPSATLSPEERDKVFLEVHIQNLTQEPMCFGKMSFECSEGWDVQDANVQESEHDISIFEGSLAVMQPQDMRQYIYILTPKQTTTVPVVHAPGSIIPLGRLDISWRTSFGEPGRLLTSVLSRRIPLAPVQQPAPALPPYLRRNVVGPVPSRPQSPQLVQSRPGSPSMGIRPASPSITRAIGSAGHPQSPIQPSALFSLPPLDVHLIVRHVPRNTIAIEKPFDISFALAITSPIQRDHRRNVKLAIQHLQPPRVSIPATSPITEPFTPRLPSSGQTTPLSATGTFNYALAHQKITIASARPVDNQPEPDFQARQSDDTEPTLPPPYYDGPDELRHMSHGAVFVGSSAVFLPPVVLLSANLNEATKDNIAAAEAIVEFRQSFVPLRRGFSTVGGLRILLVEDELFSEEEQEAPSIQTYNSRRVRTLREYDVVAEIWASE